MAIIITKNGIGAKKIEKSNFDKENYLQKFIYENPESIPLYDIREDIRLLILCREFLTDSGPIDALGIDREGNIYLIETKLYKNPDKRLVVAQVLDYGASLWKSYNFEDFINQVNSFINRQFNFTLPQKIKEFFGLDDEEVTEVIENISINFKGGNFKFVVLMDKLHQQLKDLIIYLNKNSEFDIYAVELEYYQHESYEIMIPKLYGAEIKKEIISASVRQIGNEEKFMSQIQKNLSGTELENVKKIYNFIKEKMIIYFGSGKKTSFNAVLEKANINKSIFSIYSNGKLYLHFRWLIDSENGEYYRDLFGKLIKEKTPLKLPQDWKDRTHVPFSIKEWVNSTDKLIEVFNELIKN